MLLILGPTTTSEWYKEETHGIVRGRYTLHICETSSTLRSGDRDAPARLGIVLPLRYRRRLMCADCFCPLQKRRFSYPIEVCDAPQSASEKYPCSNPDRSECSPGALHPRRWRVPCRHRPSR